ncbi:general secretion pathway protein G [Nocardioides aromaticivorans]|uniref:General secretion pathway protein G n=1 Tax=Nocardioides aromaticivorans TaxID=200618 RepID=A0A7Z0CPT1_9ACTN|nr:prepilin-type N-terminal cleavage/methylation domain-containing protein [Nocardioides aromaticivorans]NYI46633.1 general secretion pathway protein G [Nocardioides aromaticivorans]
MRRTIDRLQAARREDRGFTLIELLIVIIILGILAAVVVFSVRGISDNGEEAACKTEIRTVETAVEAAYAENGSYPGTVGALVTQGFLRAAPDGTVSSITGATAITATGALNPAPAAC